MILRRLLHHHHFGDAILGGFLCLIVHAIVKTMTASTGIRHEYRLVHHILCCVIDWCRSVSSCSKIHQEPSIPRMSSLVSSWRKSSAAFFAEASEPRSQGKKTTSPFPMPSPFSFSAASLPFVSVRDPRYTLAPLLARCFTVEYPIPVLSNEGFRVSFLQNEFGGRGSILGSTGDDGDLAREVV